MLTLLTAVDPPSGIERLVIIGVSVPIATAFGFLLGFFFYRGIVVRRIRMYAFSLKLQYDDLVENTDDDHKHTFSDGQKQGLTFGLLRARLSFESEFPLPKAYKVGEDDNRITEE